MARNEHGKGRDPWSGNENSDRSVDLKQIWRGLQNRLFGGGKRGSGGGHGPGTGEPGPALFFWLLPLAAIIWLVTGFYVMQPGEQGVILRFGNYTHTVGPGWHWHLPYPIEGVISVDTQRVRSASTRGIMLTRDESLVEVEVALQYRVNAPMEYLFELSNPDLTVEQVLKSAVREVVGTSRLNQVIQEGVEADALSDEVLRNIDLKQEADTQPAPDPLQAVDDSLVEAIKRQQQNYPEITERSRALLPKNITNIVQTTLNQYEAGVHVIAINVQYAQPPEPVQSAFEEAIKAREAKERKKNIARAYAREILARAEGQKASIISEAQAYMARKVARAEGAASRFTQLLAQYEQAPDVTRERLYLETMGEVLAEAKLIMAEEGEGGPILYLPLPQMRSNDEGTPAVEAAGAVEAAVNQGPDAMDGSGESTRPPRQPDSTDRSDNPRAGTATNER